MVLEVPLKGVETPLRHTYFHISSLVFNACSKGSSICYPPLSLRAIFVILGQPLRLLFELRLTLLNFPSVFYIPH